MRSVVFGRARILCPASVRLLSRRRFQRVHVNRRRINFTGVRTPGKFLPPRGARQSSKKRPSFVGSFDTLLDGCRVKTNASARVSITVKGLALTRVGLVCHRLPVSLAFISRGSVIGFCASAPIHIFDQDTNIVNQGIRGYRPERVLPIIGEVLNSFGDKRGSATRFFVGGPKGRVFMGCVTIHSRGNICHNYLRAVRSIRRVHSLKGGPRSTPI